MQKNLLLVNFLIFSFVMSAIGWSSHTFIYPIVSKSNWIRQVAAALDESKVPPQITAVEVATTTATSTIIFWKTNKPADSMINYNVSQDYGTLRQPATTTNHTMTISGLNPAQLYYFRVISTDDSGNQSLSNDLTFQTSDLPKKDVPSSPAAPAETQPTGNASGVGNESGAGLSNTTNGTEPATALTADQQTLVDKVTTLLDQITSADALQAIENQINQHAQEVAVPPVITGDFAKVDVTADAAQISWKTDKESNSMVYLVAESEYNPKASNPYNWSQGNANEMVKDHVIVVRGLKPATTYHYRVASKSILNLQSVSADNTFRTKSILPEIFNAIVSKVQEDQATIEFTTNVPCSSVVNYTDLTNNTVKLAGSPVPVTSHSIILTDLKFDTYYSVVINVENEQNEKTTAPPLTFTTVKDVLPPVISNVKAKSNLDQGSDNTQTIFNWRTDEPAICQMLYRSGLSKNNDTASSETNTKNKDTDFVTNHVQVVSDFKMANVYHYWIECVDKTGNKSKSDDYTILTPVREQSILDIILKNFEGTFGWLKKK